MNGYKAELLDDEKKVKDSFRFIAVDDDTSKKIAQECARLLKWPVGSQVVITTASAVENVQQYTTEQIRESMADAQNQLIGAQREVISVIGSLSHNDAKIQELLNYWKL